MKRFLFSLTLAVLPTAGAIHAEEPAQAEVMSEEVSDEVITSAVMAVSALGNAVVQGKYEVAVERMNPKWKKRYAKRAGGIEQLEKALKSVPAEMVRQGVQMISFKPQGKPQAFGVLPTRVQVGQGGGGGEPATRLIHTQWMVLVPTVTHFRITPRDGGAPLNVESISYQVAITDRGKKDWTFIDGGALTVNELRAMFVSLPQDMELPPVKKRQKE